MLATTVLKKPILCSKVPIILVPVKIQVQIVPHMKALISGALWHFAMCHSLLKIGTLLHKMSFVKTGVARTVVP